MINDVEKLSSWILLNCQNKCTHILYYLSMLLKLFRHLWTHHSPCVFSQSSQLIFRQPRLSEPVIIFTAPKAFQACSQSNKWSLSKPNRPRHPAESLGLALMHTHTFMFIRRASDSHMLSHIHIQTHTHTQIYMACYPVQRPLTWTCCSHSATHKSPGSQQHCWPSLPCWTWLHGNKSL